MTYKYTINRVPPSNNKFIGRTNKWEYQAYKKEWAELVNAFCRPRPPTAIEKSTILLRYYFKTKIRHDPDNYSGKAILDGLVKCGIIQDDSFDNISLALEGYHDKDNPRVGIIITEKEPLV